jgi:hypothetical protein
MPYYKLTDKNMRTYGGFQWELNENHKTSGNGGLCSSGWLRCYDDPLLAVLLNPIHDNIKKPRLFKIKVSGKKKTDKGLKFGFTNMKLVKEIPLPKITDLQRAAFAILCAKKVYNNARFNKWADKWLSGEDRSARSAAWAVAETAETVEAAWAVAWAVEAARAAAAAAWAVAETAETVETARAAEAAARADKPINLKAIAKKAMDY